VAEMAEAARGAREPSGEGPVVLGPERPEPLLWLVGERRELRLALQASLPTLGERAALLGWAPEPLEPHEASPDLVVLAVDALDLRALGRIADLRRLPGRPELVVAVDRASGPEVRDALLAGAADLVWPPYTADALAPILLRALEHRRLVQENLRLREVVALYEASQRMDAGLDLEHVLRVSAEGALQVAGGGACVRVVVEDDSYDEVAVGEWRSDLDLAARGGLRFALSLGERELGWLAAVPPPAAPPLDEGHRKALQLLASRTASAVENGLLYGQLGTFFLETVKGFTAALEAKDRYTKGHSDRVRVYAKLIAEALALSPEEIDRIGHAANLHDIGKLGVHSEALQKGSALDDSELDSMLAHPLRGARILQRVSLLRSLVPDVWHHHERWDGKGYPDGLRGPEIPMGARVIAVADSYDAMTTHRPYRQALPHEEAMRRLREGAGTQFDPDVVAVFLGAIENFRDACRKADQWLPR